MPVSSVPAGPWGDLAVINKDRPLWVGARLGCVGAAKSPAAAPTALGCHLGELRVSRAGSGFCALGGAETQGHPKVNDEAFLSSCDWPAWLGADVSCV